MWLLLLAALLAACGGQPSPSPTQPPVAPTLPPTTPPKVTTAPTTAQTVVPAAVPTTGQPAATATPNNTVATPKPGSLNTSFATALALGKDPIKTSVKESILYYKLDVPRGGVVTAQLTVETGSPAPAHLTLYNELQGALADIRVP